MTKDEIKELLGICEGYGIKLNRRDNSNNKYHNLHTTDDREVSIYSSDIPEYSPIISVKDKHMDLVAHLRLRFSTNQIRITINNVLMY